MGTVEKRATVPNLGLILLLQKINGDLIVGVVILLYYEGKKHSKIMGSNFGDVHIIRYGLSC